MVLLFSANIIVTRLYERMQLFDQCYTGINYKLKAFFSFGLLKSKCAYIYQVFLSFEELYGK